MPEVSKKAKGEANDNYSISGIIRNEKIRYTRKGRPLSVDAKEKFNLSIGLFLILAMIFCVLYFWSAPKIGRHLWARFGLQNLNSNEFLRLIYFRIKKKN